MNAAVSARMSEVTVATLERLGFLFAFPLEQAPAAEEAGLETAAVDFTGAFRGGLELSLSVPVLVELAANMLGTEEGRVLSVDEQRDALKELANVVCGNLLPVIAGRAQEFTLGVPYLADADANRREDFLAVSHLALDKGICRVRMRVDGQLPEGVADPAEEPCRFGKPGCRP